MLFLGLPVHLCIQLSAYVLFCYVLIVIWQAYPSISFLQAYVGLVRGEANPNEWYSYHFIHKQYLHISLLKDLDALILVYVFYLCIIDHSHYPLLQETNVFFLVSKEVRNSCRRNPSLSRFDFANHYLYDFIQGI